MKNLKIQQIKRILQLRELGWNITEISRITGISRQTIYNIISMFCLTDAYKNKWLKKILNKRKNKPYYLDKNIYTN